MQLKTRDEDVLPLPRTASAARRTRRRARCASRSPARCRCRTGARSRRRSSSASRSTATIAERAVFHRKNYFYPDLPKAYQISQYDEPLCANGQARRADRRRRRRRSASRARTSRRTRRRTCTSRRPGRIHGATATLVDFNRGGTPLVEIVTEPDLHDAETAKRFLQLLRQTVVELDLSDAELEKGSMRFDVNVSVRPAGSDELRTRTELKNMNSFNFAAKGIEREIARQIRIYEEGGDGRAGDAALRPGARGVAADALQGGGAGLPLLPRARPRPGAAARGARRAAARRDRRAARRADPRASPTRSRSTTPTCSSPAVSTGSGRRVVAAGADPKEAANVLANQFVATGIDPDAVDARRAREARRRARRDPARRVRRGAREGRRAGLQRGAVPRAEGRRRHGELDPVIDRDHRGEPRPGRAVPRRARRACSASSSAR